MIGSFRHSTRRDDFAAAALMVILSITLLASPQTLLSRSSDGNDPFAGGMVRVKGGTFTMGCTPEQECVGLEYSAHQVTLSDYYIGKYEVTQAQWMAVMGNNPSDHKGDDLPVVGVSWNDVQEFIKRLNEKTGKIYRLPTEAEWEYAARGGNKSRGYKYSGSNTIKDVAWYDGNSGGMIRTVGTKRANELGIYDMSGNVSEWVHGWYGSYSKVQQSNPQEFSLTSYHVKYHVNCGGSWNLDVRNARVSARYYDFPGNHYDSLGFRLACSSR